MKRRMVLSFVCSLILGFLITNDSYSNHLNSGSAMNEYQVIKNIEWAKPDGFALTMDIYVPQTGKSSYPVVIIYHGGGWLINNKSIMDSMAMYIVRHSEYIVCNVNYRLLGDNSDTTKMNEIIEDVFGSVLWIKENISKYRGNPSKIAVTGDSAGGQLAAMIVLCGEKLQSDRFSEGFPGYKPSYMPGGMTREDVIEKKLLTVQAAILSYSATDLYKRCLEGFENDTNSLWTAAGKTPHGIFGDSINIIDHPEWYKAISPVYNIPKSTERKLPPQFCIVGTKDDIAPPSAIQNYVSLLKEAGQTVEYWEYEGRPHAFLDSKTNEELGTAFYKDAPAAIDKIIEFLDKVIGN